MKNNNHYQKNQLLNYYYYYPTTKKNKYQRIIILIFLYSWIIFYLWMNYQFIWIQESHTTTNNKNNYQHQNIISSSSSSSLIDDGGDDDNNIDINDTSRIIIKNNNQFEWGRAQESTKGGAFVHVGKTGGSSLSILLRNGCHSWLHHPCRIISNNESMISLQISSYYHVADFGLLSKSSHDFYMISTRDPYDRTISAFVYEHYYNKRARNETYTIKKSIRNDLLRATQLCFPTLEDFVALLNDTSFYYPYHKSQIIYNNNNNNNTSSSCTNLGRAIFYGRVRIFHHLFFNYQKIYNLIPNIQNQTLFITRLEHLWQDWESINQYLIKEYDNNINNNNNNNNKNNNNNITKHNNNNNRNDYINTNHDPGRAAAVATVATTRVLTVTMEKEKLEQQQQHIRNMDTYNLPVTRELSKARQEILCQALQPEYDTYFWFISRAKNLQKHDLLTALIIAEEKCPNIDIDFHALTKK